MKESDCLEHIGEIVEIYPLPAGVIAHPLPFNAPQPAVRASTLRLSGKPFALGNLRHFRALTRDIYVNTHHLSLQIEDEVSVKESMKSSVTGVCYDTKITCKTSEDVSDARDLVQTISREPYFDVVLVDSEERIYLLRGIDPATSITLTASLPISALQQIDLEVISVNGLQRVIF